MADAVFILFLWITSQNVNETSRYFQCSCSTSRQQNTIYNPKQQQWKVLISVSRGGKQQVILRLPFCTKNKKGGVIPHPQPVPIPLSPHQRSQTEVRRGRLGKSEPSRKGRKKYNNYCRLATPAHNFHFAYCSLARLNRRSAQRDISARLHTQNR